MHAVGLHLQGDFPRLNLLGGGKVHIGEVGLVFKGFPLEPLGVHIVRQLNLSAGDHGDRMTGPGQIQAHIPSGIRAADDHHPMAQLVFMTEYGFGQTCGFGAGNGRIHRLGTRCAENRVIALTLQKLRSSFYAGMDGHVFFLQLPEQIGKILANGPLIIRRTGCHQLTAQHRGLFKQRDLMTAAGCGEGRHQSARAAADDRHLLGAGLRGKQVPLPAQPGIDGAGVVAMTAVAENAGDDLLSGRTGLELFIIVIVSQELPGHGEQVGLALLQEALHHLGIAVTAHRRTGNFDAPGLEGSGIVDGMGMALLVIQTVDMGGRAVYAANLDDVHIALQGLTEIQKILEGIAGGFLLGGNLRFDQEVLSADLLDLGEYLLCQSGPLGHGLAAVLVRPLVQQGRHGTGQNGGAVGHIKRTHIIAHVLGFPGSEGEFVD